MSALFLSAVISQTDLNTSDKEKITTVVRHFAQYADQQDVAAMSKVLDDQYRAYLNRLMGSNQVSTLDKTAYLQLLQDKKLGGDERKVTISRIDITGNNASVKMKMEGKKLNFTSYLLLAKTEAGDWKIVADMPTVAQK